MKLCTRCGQTKPLSEFGTRWHRRKIQPLAYCKPCHVDYQWVCRKHHRILDRQRNDQSQPYALSGRPDLLGDLDGRVLAARLGLFARPLGVVR